VNYRISWSIFLCEILGKGTWMKTVKAIIFSELLVLFITSCAVSPTPVTQITRAVDTPQLTNSPTHQPIPTSPITPSPQLIRTEKPIATITPTATPDPLLTYRCLDLLTTPPPGAGFEGVLALENEYLLDLGTNKRTSLGNVYDITVSPDSKKLAYLRLGSGQLVVADVHNKPLLTIPAPAIPLNPDWDHILRWLDNDRLLIEKMRYVPYKESFKLPSLIVFNPTTREKQEFLPENYPEIVNFPEPSAVGWATSSRMVPDPTLARMVYPAKGEEERPTVLWDTQKGQEITRIFGPNYGGTPIWLPDGSQFAVTAPIRFTGTYYGKHFENLPDEPSVGGEEIIGVNRDGQLKRLTYLTNTVVAHLGEMSWSPDGRYIAYWLTIDESQYPGERLAVLDTFTGQVTNYCIAGYSDPTQGQSGSPIWSPDGKYLAITVPDPKVRFQNNALVIDPFNGYAVQIADDVFSIRGWMSNSP
jgi:WD40 repeat protein